MTPTQIPIAVQVPTATPPSSEPLLLSNLPGADKVIIASVGGAAQDLFYYSYEPEEIITVRLDFIRNYSRVVIAKVYPDDKLLEAFYLGKSITDCLNMKTVEGQYLPQNGAIIDLGPVQAGSWLFFRVQNGTDEKIERVGIGIQLIEQQTTSSIPLNSCP